MQMIGCNGLVEYQLTMWGNGYIPSYKQAKQLDRMDEDELFDGYVSIPAKWKLVCHHQAWVTYLFCLQSTRNINEDGLSEVFIYCVH